MLPLVPGIYRLMVRPLLFRLEPETAQGLADYVLKKDALWRALAPVLRVSSSSLRTEVAGLHMENPIGLAAGFDKNCEFLPSMAALGFGYVTGGTVTELPQPGNPKPRLLRYPKDESLVNSLGFPSMGLDFAARQLEQNRRAGNRARVVVSVSGVTVDEIVRCHRRLEPLVDAVEINISSPNTAGLVVFQERTALAELLDRVNDGRRKAVFVKLPPYPAGDESEDRDRALALVGACVEHGVGAVTVANSVRVEDPRLAIGAGGLSGKPVFSNVLRMVADIKGEVGEKIAINACGGIFSGEDAWLALQAGATTVQLLTGLVYGGPTIVRRMNQQLLAFEGAGIPGL